MEIINLKRKIIENNNKIKEESFNPIENNNNFIEINLKNKIDLINFF